MLRLDGRMVAFSFGFDHHEVVYGLKIGYDERHARLSPGLQLMHRILELALADRTRMVDLLGDNDPYKRTVADGTSERVTADWFAPTPWSRIGSRPPCGCADGGMSGACCPGSCRSRSWSACAPPRLARRSSSVG